MGWILATAGMILTGFTMHSVYKWAKSQGADPSSAAVAAFAGYFPGSPYNSAKDIGTRLAISYSPIIVGGVGAKIIAKSGFNRYTYKGFNA